MNDDVSSFLDEMAGVKPLSGSEQIRPFNNSGISASQLERQKAAQLSQALLMLTADINLIEPVAPEEVVSVCSDGVQSPVFKQLSAGKYKFLSELDLHALTVRQAREALYHYIEDRYEKGERCVLVIHGKGFNSKPIKALIKSCVVNWLSNLDKVLAFHSAKREHGGTGALYVMLRKSELKRIESREQNHKGSGFR
ncbi:DNA endonuclease SmrA [uncultured Shewanella sp.]|uniref:DNA endonuclease SmrA n=1 Tax=Shewanella atlantica TaxID=271099 RepID=UPI0026189263|nr:DNA endonuclease SmrA [uncultured Shewanella sp.]